MILRSKCSKGLYCQEAALLQISQSQSYHYRNIIKILKIDKNKQKIHTLIHASKKEIMKNVQTTLSINLNMPEISRIVYKWHKKRNMDRLHRMESSKINPHIYGQLIIGHVPKDFREEKYPFQQIVLEQMGIYVQKSNLGPLNYTT